MEEVAGEIWEYLEGLPEDLPKEQEFEAADAAVKKIEDEASAAAGGAGDSEHTEPA